MSGTVAPFDIPIEKLLLKGTASLSDAELISILGSSNPQENSLDIAHKIMASCHNNLSEFWKHGISGYVYDTLQKKCCEVVVKPKISSSRDAVHPK